MNIKELFEDSKRAYDCLITIDEQIFWEIHDIMEQEYQVSFDEFDWNEFFSWEVDYGEEIWVYPKIPKKEFKLLEKEGFKKFVLENKKETYILCL